MTEPEERHFQQAFASIVGGWYDLSRFPDGWEPTALWHRIVGDLHDKRFDHPDVIVEARLVATREAAYERLHRMVNLPAIMAAGVHSDAEVDPEKDALLRAAIDQGWNGKGWRPSRLLTIMCSTFASKGRAAYAVALKVARQRYRDGFYANPFTRDPQRRQA